MNRRRTTALATLPARRPMTAAESDAAFHEHMARLDASLGRTREWLAAREMESRA